MQAKSNNGKWLTSSGAASNFSMRETACPCGCGLNAVEQSLIDLLQGIRDFLRTPVIIDCALRCDAENQRVSGAPHSYHLNGMAADIAIIDLETGEFMLTEKLFDKLNNFPVQGLIKYPGHNFVHVDIRTETIRLVRTPEGAYVPVES